MTVMGDARMDGLSDAGSTPAASTILPCATGKGNGLRDFPYTFPYTATAKGDIMRQSMAKYGMTSERTPVMINGNLHS